MFGTDYSHANPLLLIICFKPVLVFIHNSIYISSCFWILFVKFQPLIGMFIPFTFNVIIIWLDSYLPGELVIHLISSVFLCFFFPDLKITTLLKYYWHAKNFTYLTYTLDKFGGKYTFVKPSPQSYSSSPKVSSYPLFFFFFSFSFFCGKNTQCKIYSLREFWSIQHSIGNYRLCAVQISTTYSSCITETLYSLSNTFLFAPPPVSWLFGGWVGKLCIFWYSIFHSYWLFNYISLWHLMVAHSLPSKVHEL